MFKEKYQRANDAITVPKVCLVRLRRSLDAHEIHPPRRSVKRLAFSLTAVGAAAAVCLTGFLVLRNKKESEVTFTASQLPLLSYDEDLQRREMAFEPFEEGQLASLNAFSAQSAALVLSEREGNRLYSPLSLYYALSLLAEITVGDTQDEILEVLGMESVGELGLTGKRLKNNLSFKYDNGVCQLANSLWLNEDTKVRHNASLLERLAQQYGASSFYRSFSNPDTNDELSRWLSDNTGGHWDNGGEPPVNETLLLYNTIWLKAKWEGHPFLPRYSHTAAFQKSNGEPVDVEFMETSRREHPARSTDTFTSSYLDLQNGLKMVFVLPAEGISPDSLLETTGDLFQTSAMTEQYAVHFLVPQFSFSYESDLLDCLKSMGIRHAFTDSSGFAPLIDAGTDVNLVSAKQKTCISINEEGCEAGAFTSFSIDSGWRLHDRSVELVLDRPFLFAITADCQSGVDLPLFVGTVDDPAAR